MKILKKVEIFIYILILASIAAKGLKFHYSELILVVSMTFLMILHWILAYQTLKSWNHSKASTLVNFSLYIIASFAVLSIMFTLMFWQGGYDILLQMTKLVIFIVAFAAVYSSYQYKHDKLILWKRSKNILTKTSVIIVFGLMLYLIPFESRIEIFSVDPVAFKARLEMNSH